MVHHVIRGTHKLTTHTARLLHSVSTFYVRNPQKILDHGSVVANYSGTVVKGAGRAGLHLGRLTLKHGPKVAMDTTIFAGKVAGQAGVHIGKMVWSHGPKVAKHTTKFMVKSALKGFKLFSKA